VTTLCRQTGKSGNVMTVSIEQWFSNFVAYCTEFIAASNRCTLQV
jgi:hypothetical protein